MWLQRQSDTCTTVHTAKIWLLGFEIVVNLISALCELIHITMLTQVLSVILNLWSNTTQLLLEPFCCESSFFVLFLFHDSFPAVELMGSETFLDYSRLHIGSVLPRDILVPRVKNFVGYFSQLRFNGVDYFDRYYFWKFWVVSWNPLLPKYAREIRFIHVTACWVGFK